MVNPFCTAGEGGKETNSLRIFVFLICAEPDPHMMDKALYMGVRRSDWKSRNAKCLHAVCKRKQDQVKRKNSKATAPSRSRDM